MRLLRAQVAYRELAERLQQTWLITDPWVCGEPRFHGGPVVVERAVLERLWEASERLGRVFEALTEHARADVALLDDFYGLSPFQRLMWLSAGGWWHGFARLDAFLCRDGSLQVCELNADTPSGQVDALMISRVLRDGYPGLEDPNQDYEARLWEMLVRTHGGAPRRVGIVFPTEMPEDLTLMLLYKGWFEARGAQVVLGSPFNLHAVAGGGVGMFEQPIDLMLRHYKTDWWGEREPVWLDAPPFPDPEPLDEALGLVLDAQAAGALTVVNPFGAVLPQNKRAMAYMWERIDAFEPWAQATIRELIPPTYRLEVMAREQLEAERERWVLKSDYGCEGDEVIVGACTTPDVWTRSLELAAPGRWVAQRFFEVWPLEGWQLNLGIYLVAGQASGLLTRLSQGKDATDITARIPPTFVPASSAG